MANSRKQRSNDPLAEAARVLSHLDPAGATLSVGLSGGVDSVVLLKLLLTLRQRFGYALTAIHVNHGLSQHASAWEEFCVALCRRWKVPLAVERVRVARNGNGVEAAARAQRYRAFAIHAENALLLAHHLDDQAETMLLQLLRGAGVRGLAAMQEVSRRSPQVRVPVARPLLAVARADILAYAKRNRLQWVEDESNDVLSYRRNFLRSRVLPVIGELFPAYRETMARSAAHCSDAADLLDEIGKKDAAIGRDATHLDCTRLRKLSPVRAANALRVFLAANGLLAPDSASLREMLRQLIVAKSDASVKLMHDGAELRRYRDTVRIIAPSVAPAGDPVVWKGEAVLDLGTGRGALLFRRRGQGIAVDAASLGAAAVSVRQRTGGEKLKPGANRPRRSLKNLLQESGLPPWERETLPLLYCGENLVWVPGIGVDTAFQAAAGKPKWFVSWQRFNYTEKQKSRAPRRRTRNKAIAADGGR